MKKAEEIHRETEHLDGQKQIRAINRLYRQQDDSHLWPIRGKFNATDRAIKRAQWFKRETGQNIIGLEYCFLIELYLSEIVNGAI